MLQSTNPTQAREIRFDFISLRAAIGWWIRFLAAKYKCSSSRPSPLVHFSCQVQPQESLGLMDNLIMGWIGPDSKLEYKISKPDSHGWDSWALSQQNFKHVLGSNGRMVFLSFGKYNVTPLNLIIIIIIMIMIWFFSQNLKEKEKNPSWIYY